MYRILLSLLPLCVLTSAHAADWPMHRADAARSGHTADVLPSSLSPAWRYEPAHPPAPAWPRDDRMLFDRAFHVAIADGTLYFGSSADGKVYALDAATGEPKWTFYTDAPIRFAPAVWKDRVFVVSDDGHLYCLAADDGSLVRKWRGGPSDERVLGNARMVSRWPARGGPVIADGVLYYAAGIWQAEGVFLYALDVETGEVLWRDEESARLYMPQPHGGANAASGVTAQGHLVVDGDHLFVPTGRAVPAVFQRGDGTFRYYHLQKNGKVGGTPTMSAGPFFYNGGVAFETDTGEARTRLGAGAVAAFPGGVYHANSTQLRALKPIQKEAVDRLGKPITVPDHETEWSLSGVPGGASLISAGGRVVSGGGNTVAVVDADKREVVWTTEVDGTPYGLAAADGRLYVSTDRGTIYCFAGEASPPPRVIRAAADADTASETADPAVKKAAAEIIERAGITQGYCVDLGCGDGSLALELARRTELSIYAIDSDPENVAAARRKLDAAGLYGARVTVHLGDPAKTNYPGYFADLTVSGRSIADGAKAVEEKEASRLQRPWGGVVCLGRAGEMTVSTRGPLENAGRWTHQYADAANTGCSTDEVKGPLKTLWFRDIDLELPQRHGRGPAPLFHEGRLFHEGMDELMAVDAYNGRPLWRFEMKGVLHAYDADHIVGASQTGSNFCAAGDSLYVRHGGVCYRLDAATGEVLATFEAPRHRDGKPGTWGYIACEDGLLFGSVVDEEHIVRHAWRPADREMRQLFIESKLLFALDAKTGELQWRYDAEKSIRHNAIAIGDGRVFLIDRAAALGDRLDPVAARRGEADEAKDAHPTGKLISLNARTGQRDWTSGDDIFGTMLAFSEKHDMLLMGYQSTRFKLPSEVGGRLAVFRASEGYRIWDKPARYVTRPLINDRIIYAQGGAWDLIDGETEPFDFKRSYGCGQLAASKHLLLFRSATLGYFDFSREAGTEDFGGVRPGCWINAIPAGGLVLVPDASAGCTCSYQNRAWVALQGSGE